MALTQQQIDKGIVVSMAMLVDLGIEVADARYKGDVKCFEEKRLKFIYLAEIIEALVCKDCLTLAQQESLLVRVTHIAGSFNDYQGRQFFDDLLPDRVAYMIEQDE